jgi:hypothetical protein
MIRRLALLVAGLALAACTLDGVFPQPSLDGLPQGLDVRLTVAPEAVGALGEFSAVLTLTNTTADSLRFTTTDGCLATPNVYREGVRYLFWGSGSPPCLTALTTHSFAPGETLTKTWNMRAELSPVNPGGAHGDPAPAGTYQVQAEFRIYTDGALKRAAVESTLRVR